MRHLIPSSQLRCLGRIASQIGPLIALLLAFAAACAPPADLAPAGGSNPGTEPMVDNLTVPIPRGLANAQDNVAYVADLQGHVQLLDLGSGASLARTSFQAQPLTLYGNALIGWAAAPGVSPAVRIYALEKQGSALQSSWDATLALPPWVELGSPEPGLFSIGAQINGGWLEITWEARARYAGGAPPPAEIEEAELRAERQTVRIDLGSGSVLSEAQLTPSDVPEQTLPVLPAGLFIVPYLRSGEWDTIPWRFGPVEAYLVRDADQAGIQLVRRTAGGGAEERAPLSKDPGAEATVTPDGRFIFVHEPSEHAAGWRVFSVQSGELVAQLPYEPGTEDVAVLDSRVLYLVAEENGGARQLSLRCRSLDTGDAKWQLPLGAEVLGTPPPLQP